MTQPCYTGAPTTRGVGECRDGTQTCLGSWGTCTGQVTPIGELCNGKDDDCDGNIDEGAGVCGDCTVSTYSGHTYMFCTSPKEWADARTSCSNRGYHLVTMNSDEENTWVFSQLPSTYWWIGANDLTTEGTWTWVDGTAWSYTNWWGGEPNNKGNEDCGEINYLGRGAKWNDHLCYLQKPFICELG